MNTPKRTDTRPINERRLSVQLRITELRKALRDAEMCAAEIDREAEGLGRDAAE
jgi:hypothetical protein